MYFEVTLGALIFSVCFFDAFRPMFSTVKDCHLQCCTIHVSVIITKMSHEHDAM